MRAGAWTKRRAGVGLRTAIARPMEPNANRGSAARPRVVMSSAVRARGSPRTLPRAIADATSWAPRLIELEAMAALLLLPSVLLLSVVLLSVLPALLSPPWPSPLAGRSLGYVLGAVALAVLLAI